MAQGQGSADRLLALEPSRRHQARRLARLARLRWKIELDYKQLKGELGLDHYEGRSSLGWYHHTALVTAAYGFLTLERQNPNHQRPA
jgi:SRSO17 transposase